MSKQMEALLMVANYKWLKDILMPAPLGPHRLWLVLVFH